MEKDTTCFFCDNYYHADPDTDRCKLDHKEVYFDTPKCKNFFRQKVQLDKEEKAKRVMYKDTAVPPFEDDDPYIVFCAVCKSGEYLHNEDGARNVFCGQCGQRIDWPALDELEKRMGACEHEEKPSSPAL